MSDFVFPEVHASDVVGFSRSPENPNSFISGFVTKVNTDSVDVAALYPRGALRQFIGCRHRDDPWLKAHPDILQEDDTGVFIEGPRMIRMAALEKQVAEMAAKLAGLKYDTCDTAVDGTLDIAPRRGRRPGPKPELETVNS